MGNVKNETLILLISGSVVDFSQFTLHLSHSIRQRNDMKQRVDYIHKLEID